MINFENLVIFFKFIKFKDYVKIKINFKSLLKIINLIATIFVNIYLFIILTLLNK